MLDRRLGAARWAVDFGPLVVFWAVDLAVGLRAAIAASVLFIVFDSLWRWRRGRPFTRLYLLASALTVAFGAFDLLSATPFMLKYEAVITNIATAIAFVVGARGPKAMI